VQALTEAYPDKMLKKPGFTGDFARPSHFAMQQNKTVAFKSSPALPSKGGPIARRPRSSAEPDSLQWLFFEPISLGLPVAKICTAHPQRIRLLFAYGRGTCINFANALGWQDLLCLQGIPET
jgi:hypothetical protein